MEKDKFRASPERLTAVLDASHDCISVVDPVEFRLMFFNQAFAKLIRKAHHIRVTSGMRAEDVAPELAAVWNAFYRQVLTQGTISQEYRVPGLNETHQIVAAPLKRYGRMYGICTFGHDITHRKQMDVALRRSEEKFAKTFRAAPLALSLTSLRDQRFIDANEAYTEATGFSMAELLGKNPVELGIWVEPERRMEFIQQLQTTGTLQNVEFRYRTKAGDIRDAIGSGVQIEIGDEPCMLATMMDITERKRTLQALRESEERLRIAIEAGNMYAFQWDVATDAVERSEQSLRILDISAAGKRHTKQELIDRILPEDRQEYIAKLRSVTPERPDYKTVFRLQLRNGRTAWLEESGRAIFRPDGTLKKVIGITSDVTEIRESERALRNLSARLITSQEEERRRIARELHDHIGQETALLCVQAEHLDSGRANEEHTTRSDVHELYRRLKTLAADISRLSHRLHSSELNFLGLAIAAEGLCRDFACQYGVDIDQRIKTLPAHLDKAKSLCLYRVLEEALQNVMKHSHATRVLVQLQSIGNEVGLEVQDNGEGFDVESARQGLGLLSMRERLRLLGGQFVISSKPGSGTSVTACLPV